MPKHEFGVIRADSNELQCTNLQFANETLDHSDLSAMWAIASVSLGKQYKSLFVNQNL